MTATPNPIATEHLPFFITPPGQTDVLFNVVAVFVVLCVIGLGVIFFTIHALPERIAHRTKKVQLDIVAVLVLISLFTNEHIFWIAALLLAFIDFPDFLSPVLRIATAIESIAGQEKGLGAAPTSPSEMENAVSADAERGAGEPASRRTEPAEALRQIKKGPAHA
jgi:amino acid transporter